MRDRPDPRLSASLAGGAKRNHHLALPWNPNGLFGPQQDPHGLLPENPVTTRPARLWFGWSATVNSVSDPYVLTGCSMNQELKWREGNFNRLALNPSHYRPV